MDHSWAVSFLGQFETNNICSQADFDPVGKKVQVERAVPGLIPRKPNEDLLRTGNQPGEQIMHA
jgi:hypothetical protein